MNPRSYLFILLAVAPGLAANALNQPLVLSAYQGPSEAGDFEANLRVVRRVTQQARDRRSAFLVLPECFLSGYANREAVERGARRLDDPGLQGFIAESAEHGMVILAGLARRAGTNLFNTVLVIHRGRLLGMQDKLTVSPLDRDSLGFSPGRQLTVFEAHGVRFGALIGADTSYPEPALSARLQGAELLFALHNDANVADLTDSHRSWVRNQHMGLACQLNAAVARANTVPTNRPGSMAYGNSFILSPQGEAIAEADHLGATLITGTVTPTMFRGTDGGAELAEAPAWLRTQVSELFAEFRRPADDEDLRFWVENMLVYHQFSAREISEATGLDAQEVDATIARFDLGGRKPPTRVASAPLTILPYPGGRHPRRGFFDGAVAPQRETKMSVFAPWDDGGYVVVDVPEAIFSNLGLTYLAHTHIPTLWDRLGIKMARLEWRRDGSGTWTSERTLPNGIAFGAEARSEAEGVRFQLWLRNGTTNGLSGLRVQNCVMLGGAPQFSAQTLTNKVFVAPFAAARASDGNRWVITAWERCRRAWGNEFVPCLHADPVFPDCAPGETVQLAGWLSFYEGWDVRAEFGRLDAAAVLVRK